MDGGWVPRPLRAALAQTHKANYNAKNDTNKTAIPSKHTEDNPEGGNTQPPAHAKKTPLGKEPRAKRRLKYSSTLELLRLSAKQNDKLKTQFESHN